MKFKSFAMLAAIGIALGVAANTAPAADFATPITQLDGKPFTDTAGKEIETTLCSVSEVALLSAYPDEQALDGIEKNKRFWFARSLRDTPGGKCRTIDLSAEDTALLKKLIAKAYTPLIVGQAWLLLDPKSTPK